MPRKARSDKRKFWKSLCSTENRNHKLKLQNTKFI